MRLVTTTIAAVFAVAALTGCDARQSTYRTPPKPLKIDEAKLKAEADKVAEQSITRDNVNAETEKLESAIRAELK